VGLALWMPIRRAPWLAAATTPCPWDDPPTITAQRANWGRSRYSTAAQKASMSPCSIISSTPHRERDNTPLTFNELAPASSTSAGKTLKAHRKICLLGYREGHFFDNPKRKCERRESNPHALRHWILSPARLPVPPLSL